MTGKRLFVFITPFASPAATKHASKLIDCLAPNCETLFVMCDKRVDLSHKPAYVYRICHIPTLHYLYTIKPTWWSALQWILKLMWILSCGVFAIIKLCKQIDTVCVTQGSFYTPILLTARLIGKKTISYEPGNDIASMRVAYEKKFFKNLLLGTVCLITYINRNIEDIIAIESYCLIDQINLKNFIKKVRLGNLYIDENFYKIVVPFELRQNVVGFLGRLSLYKGVLELIKASVYFKESDVVFLIMGDGVLRSEIEKILATPEFFHVKYIGWISDDNIVSYLNQLRLLVMPSDLEGLPNVALEAMACGTPILATPVGGIPDVVIPGETGFLLQDKAPESIRNGIWEALNHPYLDQISTNARQHVVKNYSLQVSSMKWVAICNELASNNH